MDARPSPVRAPRAASVPGPAAVEPRHPEGDRNRALLVNGPTPPSPVPRSGFCLQTATSTPIKPALPGATPRCGQSCFGKARPTVAHDLVEPHDAPWRPEDRLVQVREAFESLCHRLERDQKQQLDLLVIDGKVPGWFRAAKLGRRLSAVDLADQAALLSGLEALARR